MLPKLYSQSLKGSRTGIPRCRWKVNFEIDVKDIISGRVHWIYLTGAVARKRLYKTSINLLALRKARNFLTS
jgi:hypothetical protein